MGSGPQAEFSLFVPALRVRALGALFGGMCHPPSLKALGPHFLISEVGECGGIPALCFQADATWLGLRNPACPVGDCPHPCSGVCCCIPSASVLRAPGVSESSPAGQGPSLPTCCTPSCVFLLEIVGSPPACPVAWVPRPGVSSSGAMMRRDALGSLEVV